MPESQILAVAMQFPVSMDVPANLDHIATLLKPVRTGTIVVTPEGALSGYAPDRELTSKLDRDATNKAIEFVSKLAVSSSCHIVSGACVEDDGHWRNSSFIFCPDGVRFRYDKINLAHSEQGVFEPGNDLPVFRIEAPGKSVGLGIQMCREIRYPEQWRIIAERGAEVFAYPNNAIGSTMGHALWRSHLISRAAETQRFIVGANNAASDQTCPTMIVDPRGVVLAELAIGETGLAEATLNLEDVSNWVLDQARRDIVTVSSCSQREGA